MAPGRQQFAKYCDDIRKQQQLIDKLKQQRAETFLRFQHDVLPIEQQYIQHVYNNTLRLCELISRKSFSASQRDDLVAFLDENMSLLTQHPFTSHVDVEALSVKVLALCAQYAVSPEQDDIDYFREYIEMEYPEKASLTDEELAALMKEPQKLDEMFRMKQEQKTEAHHDNDDDFDFFADEHDSPLSPQQRKLDELFSDSIIKKMYKRLASVLHPDKALNDESRQQKHDVWEIFAMYQQYVDADAAFSSEEMPAINSLLKQRVSALKNEYKCLQYDDYSMEGMVWTQFCGRTPKSIDKKLELHQQKLREMIADEEKMFEHFATVKSTQRYLSMLCW